MRQEIEAQNSVDANGNPTGGHVKATGFSINWQSGPLGRGTERAEPNGAFVEGVIAAALQRLMFYQTASYGHFACKQNMGAIYHLEQALRYLDERTRERETRQVEGTHTP
jgi:hypothetical protein